MMHFERPLILSPHTDDAELGCGGTIARYRGHLVGVHVVAFSKCADSLPPDDPDRLQREFFDAAVVLGTTPTLLDYPVRRFTDHRQDILEDMVRLWHAIDPDVVYIPSAGDQHQDHQVIRAEALRAFQRSCSVVSYELPWNDAAFRPTAFVALADNHVRSKVAALACYGSQAGRPYAAPAFTDSHLRVRGAQAGTTWAEAFEVVRLHA